MPPGTRRNDDPIYRLFHSIKQRCHNERSRQYDTYGGRGIRMDAQWLGDGGFQRFKSDVLAALGPRPGLGFSIDRVDVNGDYVISNMRWATISQQARNKRQNVFIEIDDVKRCCTEWSEISGVKPDAIRGRLHAGWAPAEAVFRPAAARRTGRQASMPAPQVVAEGDSYAAV